MKILTVSQIRAAEEDAVKSGIFSFMELMENAAEKSADYLIKNVLNKNDKICVVCGKGNNGGDGLVTAYILSNEGYDVSVIFPFGKPMSSPANEFLGYCEYLNEIEEIPEKCDVLIDALFGIGFDRPLDSVSSSVIDKMNGISAKKIAIDIPSGVFADKKQNGNAFFADITLTFIALKPCFVLPPFNENCGKAEVIDIGVPIKEFAYKTIDGYSKPKRRKNAHKGDFGRALLITGCYGMAGAQILCAKAALSSGAGIVKSFVCDKNYTAFLSSVPEAVTVPVGTYQNGAMQISENQLFPEIAAADSVVIGCGIGRTKEAEEIVNMALSNISVPTVIDADGLNALSLNIELLRRKRASVIITPHEGEMAKLCGVSAQEIRQNRAEYAKKFAVTYEVTVVLKGANTIVATPDGRVYFNTTGNPGMATGGSGDVLAGIIGARLAAGEEANEAAKNAVYMHGLAGDNALKKYSMEGLLPSDIINELKTL